MDLRANTQVVVPMGIFVDVGDGFTPEEAVALSNAATSEASIRKADGSVVTIDARTWAHLGANGRGHYNLTLQAGDVDQYGNLRAIITNDAVHLPVWKDFNVMNEAEWDRKYTNAQTAAKQTAALDRIVLGQAVTGTLSTTTMTTNLGAAHGDMTGRIVVWYGDVTAALAEVQREISAYNTSTGQVTWVDAVGAAPANLDSFVIV